MNKSKPTDEEIAKWHRWFAVECNNEAWSLADQPKRTSVEDEQMLRLAHTAAMHWAKVGGPVHVLRADVLLAWVHAAAGLGMEAQRYAERAAGALDTVEGVGDWDRAFMPIAMCFGHHAAGDSASADTAAAQLDAARQTLTDEEDRKVFDHYRAMLPKAGA